MKKLLFLALIVGVAYGTWKIFTVRAGECRGQPESAQVAE